MTSPIDMDDKKLIASIQKIDQKEIKPANSFSEKERSDVEFLDKLSNSSTYTKAILDALPYPTHSRDGLPYIKWKDVPSGSLVRYGTMYSYAVRIGDRGWWVGAFYQDTGWQKGLGWPWSSYMMKDESCVIIASNIIGWETKEDLATLGVTFDEDRPKIKTKYPVFLSPEEWKFIIPNNCIIKIQNLGLAIYSENKLHWASTDIEIFWKPEKWGTGSSVTEFAGNNFKRKDIEILKETTKETALSDLIELFKEKFNKTPKINFFIVPSPHEEESRK